MEKEEQIFVAIAKGEKGNFKFKEMPLEMVEKVSSKEFTLKMGKEDVKFRIIRLSGEKHKNAGEMEELPELLRSMLPSALKELNWRTPTGASIFL